MSPAEVLGSTLVFTVDDPQRSIRRVILDCDDAVGGPRRFRRTATGWSLRLPVPELVRLEYRLIVTSNGGETVVVLDSGNPERVATAFGYRSVALLPGYEGPSWLEEPARPGSIQDLTVPTERVGDLPVGIWTPPGTRRQDKLALLVVHDGPEMVRLARIDQYAAAMIDSSSVPPFRMMLCQPVRRDEWYAANPDYQAAEVDAIEQLSETYGIDRDRVVVMGASLGGLTALLLGLGKRADFAGVLSQSGSFFTPELDPQESSYPWFDQITDAVHTLEPSGHRPMPIALTCGASEENAANNREMRERLREAGHDVRHHEFPDLHNYTAWRDAWHPMLTDLLRDCWAAP